MIGVSSRRWRMLGSQVVKFKFVIEFRTSRNFCLDHVSSAVFALSRYLRPHVIVMTSPSLLSSAIPWSPTIDDSIHSPLEECERSRDWWKHRVSVLDLRCREINAQLRDTLAENKRSIPLGFVLTAD